MILRWTVTALAANAMVGIFATTPGTAAAVCPAHRGAPTVQSAHPVAPSSSLPTPPTEGTMKVDTAPAKTPPKPSQSQEPVPGRS